jgi:hypothetical protein
MAPSLIGPGDKFALIAAQLAGPELEQSLLQVADNLWVMNSPPVEFSDHWRGWLGTIRTEHLEDSDLVVIARAPSQLAVGPRWREQEAQR